MNILWGIAGTILLSGYFCKCAPLLKEIRQRFFALVLEHCTFTRLQRILSEDLYFFIGTVTLIHLQD